MQAETQLKILLLRLGSKLLPHWTRKSKFGDMLGSAVTVRARIRAEVLLESLECALIACSVSLHLLRPRLRLAGVPYIHVYTHGKVVFRSRVF